MSMASFTSKDLALLLPDQVGDAFTMMHTEDKTSLQAADVQSFKPKIDVSKKISRLRAGQATAEDPVEEEPDFAFGTLAPSTLPAVQAAPTNGSRPKSRWDSTIDPNEVKARRAEEGWWGRRDEDEEDESRRPRAAAAVLEEDDDEPVEGDTNAAIIDDDEDEDAIAARRARVRERLKRRQEEEEEVQDEAVDEEAEDEDGAKAGGEQDADESEYETDTDEESENEAQLLKPVFVAKAKRSTILELELKAKEEEKKNKAKAAALEARKLETRNMVADQIKREADAAVSQANQAGNDSDPSHMPNDEDEEDPVEHEAWRQRELARVARDAALKSAFEAEKAETERRRGLTEAQRQAEDAALGKNKEEPKEKWKFMQKYYHKGAFYMDETAMAPDDVRKRSFGEATLEDRFDKAALPKVMQVKKFGFSGQTKYTHLKDQDTTDYDSAWMQDIGKRKEYDSKLAGLGDIDTAGRKRKK